MTANGISNSISRLPALALGMAACLLLGDLRAADDPLRVFPGDVPDRRLGNAVTLDGDHPWTPPGDLDGWKRRAERTRRQVLVAAGLWPAPPRTPLAAVVHGAIERDDYTVEKVFFQSFPGFWVTGSLYRPKDREGKLPAVLSPHGHWPNGRFHERSEAEARAQIEAGKEKLLSNARYLLQARCAHLARMGCVVFHYDMVGYADSQQLGHGAGFGDVEAELHLQSAFGLQTWNTVRAFDFLAGLPDVDPARIGVTGASGGGTQTFVLCAIDARPAAAFPAVMVSTDMQGGCVCENASHLRVGTNNVELAALAAPRPYALTGANDWTLHILEKGLPELKSVYRLYGAEEQVAAWCYPAFEHNYNLPSRTHMYQWFREHLALGEDASIEEREIEPIAPADLAVFDEEHPLPPDAATSEELRAWWRGATDAQLGDCYPRTAEALERFRDTVGGALAVMLHTRLPAPDEVESEERGTTTYEGFALTKLVLRRRGGPEAIPALLYRPEDWGGNVAIGISPRGKPSAAEGDDNAGLARMLSAAREQRLGILLPDVYLTGEYARAAEGSRAPLDPSAPSFGKDTARHGRFVGYTYGYNRTLLAERVHDVLTAVGVARALPGCRKAHVVAEDGAVTWAVLARALAGEAIDKLVLRANALPSFRTVNALDHADFLPGALRYGDLPAFLALSAPHWLLHHLPDPLPPIVRDAYEASDAGDRAIDAARRRPDLAAGVLAWLAE